MGEHLESSALKKAKIEASATEHLEASAIKKIEASTTEHMESLAQKKAKRYAAAAAGTVPLSGDVKKSRKLIILRDHRIRFDRAR
jgi:hypothetical protein